MKKALSALIVALFCVLILVGCREKEKETAPDNAETNADHALGTQLPDMYGARQRKSILRVLRGVHGRNDCSLRA